MFESSSDEALMLEYRRGELPAFMALYGRHRQGLYQFIAWRSPRKDWVEEIVQDTWASLHKARETYQPQSSFKTFLYQIAKNRMIDLIRQKQAILAAELGHGDEAGSRFDHLADIAAEVSSPEDTLATRQQVADLHAAIRALPSEQKDALILQQYNGMSLDEIAEITGATVETVKSRLRYAMNKLRRQLLAAPAQSEPA